MVFLSGNKEHHFNDDYINSLTYEQIVENYTGKLDVKRLLSELGLKPTKKVAPKKATKKEEEK